MCQGLKDVGFKSPEFLAHLIIIFDNSHIVNRHRRMPKTSAGQEADDTVRAGGRTSSTTRDVRPFEFFRSCCARLNRSGGLLLTESATRAEQHVSGDLKALS